MGIETVLLVGSLLTTAYAVSKQQEAQQEARKEQKKAKAEQGAINAAKAAQEQRQQIREERIRRARILQASENTGVSESSGQVGAVSGLSTQLQTNLGFNEGMISSANRITEFQQNAADALGEADRWKQIGSLSQSIFSAAGTYARGVSAAPTSSTQ